ncbi:MAG: ABC transporter permease [Verrucomicrobiaceae bacterium]|jgi:spermidine/putrescine transport system permease protein|nr:ABC transporter permease [Verrucomicrobiaceae bacterium]
MNNKKYSKPLLKSKLSLPELLLSMPSTLWLVLFFLIPSFLVFAIAFKTADPSGGIDDTWTLQTIKNVLRTEYVSVIWRTIWVSVVVTIICLMLSIPVAYWISRQNPKYRYWYLLAVIVPLWTNFLIRIFAWRILLNPEGILRKSLIAIGLLPDDVFLLNNIGAVIIVSVYTSLPFAILPIYAAAEKFNYSLLEAAQDLGASRFKAFYSVFIPGIKRGIFTAILVVLIPAMGAYAIPDLVGGVNGEMLGNKIAIRASAYRNLPEAAALAALLSIIITIPIILALVKQRGLTKSTLGNKNSARGVSK